MKRQVTIITQNKLLARTIEKCIESVHGEQINTYYMTYGQSNLSNNILLKTDLFILEMFGHDALGSLPEGLYLAEHYAKTGKKSLIISHMPKAEWINSLYYWDPSSQDQLFQRIIKVLEMTTPTAMDFMTIRTAYSTYCRPKHDGHHSQ